MTYQREQLGRMNGLRHYVELMPVQFCLFEQVRRGYLTRKQGESPVWVFCLQANSEVDSVHPWQRNIDLGEVRRPARGFQHGESSFGRVRFAGVVSRGRKNLHQAQRDDPFVFDDENAFLLKCLRHPKPLLPEGLHWLPFSPSET